ncbi:glycine receptor subunit alphaZ1-like isoform X2 [Oratosquilla oratoria]|uniref:glycine receptor subunit alphaZ1-like isoform X2 n=1 Tax=Oratosquilla oratoria TaxID=337810 RepID=UPI003F76A53D
MISKLHLKAVEGPSTIATPSWLSLFVLLFLPLFLQEVEVLADDGMAKALTIEDIMPLDRRTYDKMRPPKKDGKPTVVYFHVTVMGIDSINENSMTYAADIFFAQSWKDHRLRLPENMTSEYRLLDLDWLKELWRPDSFFKNAKQVTFQTMTIPNHYVWLYQTKSILYMVKLTLKLSCAMNFAIYPHDTQECKLQMESLSHTTEELVFEWDPDVPLVVDESIELPQQNIIQNITSDCTQVYSTGNFTCLEVIFKLKRRLGYYVFHTYIPTCLIVIMSWVSFWIKPEIAPARVTLGVTSLLTLSTQHAKSQAALPPVSYIKTIDAFMSSCTVFVFMALMEYAVVNIILGDGSGDGGKKPPAPDKREGKISSIAIKESHRLLTGEPPKPTGPTQAQIRRARAVMVDRVSRYLFPISFAVLNAIYWITFRKYL